MKVGGNESATKYFQSHGGSAALISKDPKTKYNSATAVKYKEELKRRAAEDAKVYEQNPFHQCKYADVMLVTLMRLLSRVLRILPLL